MTANTQPGNAWGARFANYVVADAGSCSSSFLHTATELGLPAVARLKEDRHELSTAGQRIATRRPDRVLAGGPDRVDFWDSGDFDLWETLNGETVRGVGYRQTKPDGEVLPAGWLTNRSTQPANSLAVYGMAKSRWEIEHEGFKECRSRQGFEHAGVRSRRQSVLLPASALNLNPAVATVRIRHLRVAATGCSKNGCHPEDDLRSSWNLVAANAELGAAGAELPFLG